MNLGQDPAFRDRVSTRRHRIIVPPLSRTTLVLRMCEDGTFETTGDKPTNLGWLVYEDSFLKWVEGLDAGEQKTPRDNTRRPVRIRFFA